MHTRSRSSRVRRGAQMFGVPRFQPRRRVRSQQLRLPHRVRLSLPTCRLRHGICRRQTFPAQGAGADSRGSHGSPGDSTSVPQPVNPRFYPSISKPKRADRPRPSVPSAGQVSSVPVEDPQGQQQPTTVYRLNGKQPTAPGQRGNCIGISVPQRRPSALSTTSTSSVVPKRPPAKGFRRFLFKLTGGKVNPGQSQAELEYLELVKRINQPSRGVYKIAFVSLKGGVGKTTAAKTVGSTFASLRGDRVIAIDANPDAGTLADREHREHRYTVRDLLADHHIRTYSDVRHYTSQGDSRLEILANETDPATSRSLQRAGLPRRAQDVGGALQHHHHRLRNRHDALGDEGNPRRGRCSSCCQPHRPGRRTVGCLHLGVAQRARTSTSGGKGSGGGPIRHGPGSSSLDLSQLEDVFRQQGVRAVRIIPFDEHLGEGGPIDLPLLSKKTETCVPRTRG